MTSITQTLVGLLALAVCSTAMEDSMEFRRSNAPGEAKAQFDPWRMKFCGAMLSFFTVGTTARVIVGSGNGGFHSAVLVEGPLRFEETEVKYLLIHYMPGGIRLEGDDSLSKLEATVLKCGGATTIWKGPKRVIDPKETPIFLFTQQVCDVIMEDGLPKFNMGPTQRNLSTPICTAVTRWNLRQSRQRIQTDPDQERALKAYMVRYGRNGDTENFMNCLRFVNMLCFHYKLQLPQEIIDFDRAHHNHSQ